MSGDPVEESSQAVRQGFLQALQTAHTTAGLMRSMSGDGRSKAEFARRMQDSDAREQRSIVEHNQRVWNAAETANQARQLNDAKVKEVNARIERGGELSRAEVRKTNRQTKRGDEDLKRRNAAGELERTHRIAIHDKQVTGYTNREARAAELHKLEVEYKTLLIDIRRRAAGFSETLTGLGHTGEAMASAAGFATAQAAAGLSEQHASAFDAYADRLVEDTGMSVDELADKNLSDLAAAWEQAGQWTQAFDDISSLTEYLSLGVHLDNELDARMDAELDPEDSSSVEEAVFASGAATADLAADPDLDPDTDLPPSPSRVPESGQER